MPDEKDEKIKPAIDAENSVTQESETEERKNKLELLATKRICNARCNICGSEHVAQIHELRKSGAEYQAIIDVMKKEHNVVFSTASLSRHFSNFYDRQIEISTQMVSAELISEAAAKSYHTQRTLQLLKMALDQIVQRAEKGQYIFDLSDVIKLADLKYKTLVGNENLSNDIMAIFQKATNKYGVNLSQGVLFKRAEQNLGEPDE
jgi:transcription elongation factor Elf1